MGENIYRNKTLRERNGGGGRERGRCSLYISMQKTRKGHIKKIYRFTEPVFEYISPCYLIFRCVCRIVKSHHSLRHVCPSEWNNWATTGRIFIKFDVLTIFKKSVIEIQVTLFQPSSRKTRGQNRQTCFLLYSWPKNADRRESLRHVL